MRQAELSTLSNTVQREASSWRRFKRPATSSKKRTGIQLSRGERRAGSACIYVPPISGNEEGRRGCGTTRYE